MIEKKYTKCVICRSQFISGNSLHKVCSLDCAVKLATEKEELKKKQERKQWLLRKEMMKIEVKSKDYKSELQISVNKLARMIDARFDLKCIDCGKDFGNQCDGGHFASVGSNPTLRFNLHNIHSQKSDCNRNGLGGGKRLEYRRGLEQRYGLDYADYVEYNLPLTYKTIHLSNQEIYDINKLAKRIVRQFPKLKFDSPIQGRDLINSLLGIYKNN